MMKFLYSLLIAVTIMACTERGSQDVGGDEVEKKVDALMARMTLDEKIGQLNQLTSWWEMTGPAPKGLDTAAFYAQIREGKVGSLLNVTGAAAALKVQKVAVEESRLGIPLILGYDVIHGYKTMFPIPLAEAASWEPELARRTASAAATEASAAGINWTFAPMVDVSRDARWGRVMEGAGEDPYLGSLFAAARVKGFQGDNLAASNTIAACAKHFAAYGFVEAGRDYNSVELGNATLYNVVLPPFKAAADVGVATFMNAFNTLNGVPATASSFLQRDILKGKWKFNGFVVSDWNSIGELIDHGVAANKREAALLALKAGSDMDMQGLVYISALKELVQKGEIEEALLDEAVRRILHVKFCLGLFDDPYQYCDLQREQTDISTPEHLQLAREAARKSIVLLKNDKQMLPLPKQGLKIAVIGELAASKDVPLGSWRAQAVDSSAVSLLEGLKNVAPSCEIRFARGPRYVQGERSFIHALKINETDWEGMNEAVKLAAQCDVVVMALGEDCFQSGEARSQTDIGLKGLQMELFRAIQKVNSKVVVVLMNGRPLAIGELADKAGALVEAWHLGSQAGNAIADVLFGDYNPSGKLPVSFPLAVGQVPIYYNHQITGRPDPDGDLVFYSHYTDAPVEPLFPFGYGLSYTQFEYANLSLSASSITPDDTLRVLVDVQNTGNRYGEEVAQLYLRDLVAQISRPVKELKGFRKIALRPGETKRLVFELTVNDLGYFNNSGKWLVDAGVFNVWVGPNSAEGLEGSFELVVE